MNGFMKRLLPNSTHQRLYAFPRVSLVQAFLAPAILALLASHPAGFGGAAFAAPHAPPEKSGREASTGSDSVTITKSSATLRSAPEPGANPVGIAYGNDRFQVQERISGWARVKWKGRRSAWVEESDFRLTFIETAKLAEENKRGNSRKNRAASASYIARNRSHGANGFSESGGMERATRGKPGGTRGKPGIRGLIPVFSAALGESFAGGRPRRAGVMSMAAGAMVAYRGGGTYRGGSVPRAIRSGYNPRSSHPRLGRVSGIRNGRETSTPAKMLIRAKGYQVSGKRREARKAFLDLIQRYPGTIQFYEAVRQMNFYYPLGEFPPLRNGRVNQRSMDLAEGKLNELLIGEGNTLLAEKRPLEAVAVFEMALLNGGDIWEGSTNGLQNALGAYLSDPPNEQNRREYQLAKDTFDHYFPERFPPDSKGSRLPYGFID